MSAATPFDSIETAIQTIAAGGLIIVTDDEGRENEGDLLMAAEKATPELVNMMIRHARGLICVPMAEPQLKRLGINPMVQQNREAHRTAFTVSVDAAEGITTGISAFDRARTIRLLADPATRSDELVQPGHIFPLCSRAGGVLERAGHTEAAVDFAALAGLRPAGVICEILSDDGKMARLPELIEFKRRHGLPLVSIAALIEYRHRREQLVEQVATRPFASEYGEFQLHVFRSKVDGRHHLAFTKGKLDTTPTLVRVHTENLLSDVFHATDMGSHRSLLASLERVAKAGHGVIVYMEQTGRMQEALLSAGQPAAGGPGPANLRDYGTGAQILTALGLKQIRLLQHSPRRVVGLDGYGLEIVEQIPV
ncbi:3,4-dihydroxy-2-butanone-4-phosphate synthase [Opitutus sp. GAS368]|jgi:3,4-dihydroxy 2-butanone 4-phosphate synthase/GTP cyclohydrolase II|uniref:3,4-dihydroxy-2-butanone-4-phosphate synthase n=1 Tax=Opitutus sp. GAS368 TaxID=1882749 RepID=UPI0008796EE6|nr:3,4-dihydroxy-2-butanone-4-phosphate synthase [Opitutus sp. GAS368]SDS14895.1 3,4-dihydroxy 2-butanone 4-phosphate synthase / GTP cyclohydrolase II [Opitutus sp. GAS368]